MDVAVEFAKDKGEIVSLAPAGLLAGGEWPVAVVGLLRCVNAV